MDGGILHICVLEKAEAAVMGKLITGAFFDPHRGTEGWESWEAESLRLETVRGRVPIGLDGEALEFETPLEIVVRPRSLRVRVPRGTPPGPQPERTLREKVSALTDVAAGRESESGGD